MASSIESINDQMKEGEEILQNLGELANKPGVRELLNNPYHHRREASRRQIIDMAKAFIVSSK